MLAPNNDVESVIRQGAPAGRLAVFRRRAIWAAAAIVVLVAAVLWWQGRSGGGEVVYETSPATRGDITVSVTATGTVQPINQVEIGSELSGKVSAVNVDFNDPVKAGDVLAVIDTDKLTAQANRTKAQLEVANANVAVAEATLRETDEALKRQQSLRTRDFSSNQEIQAAQAAYDRALASLDSANAQVKVAAADLASTESDLGKAQIRSPIGGVILTRAVDPGQTVAASLQAPVLFTVAEDLSKMRLLVDVDESDAGSVREGQDASFTVEAFPEKTFTAKVIQLRYASETVSNVVTYKAVLSADNTALSLRPGMTATATIVVRNTAGALLVPNAALRFSPAAAEAARNRSLLQRLIPGGPPPGRQQPVKTGPASRDRTVYVLRDGAPAAVAVVIGDSDGSRTAIVSGGLAEGDAVITGTSSPR